MIDVVPTHSSGSMRVYFNILLNPLDDSIRPNMKLVLFCFFKYWLTAVMVNSLTFRRKEATTEV